MQVWAIVLVYFVQGILGLAALAKTFYLKDTLHLGWASSFLKDTLCLQHRLTLSPAGPRRFR